MIFKTKIIPMRRHIMEYVYIARAYANKCIILSFMVMLLACSPDYGKGFHTSSKEYMELFVSELEKNNISFIVESDGMVLYKSKYESSVVKIHNKIKNKLASSTAVKYKEVDARNYLKSILESKDIDFKEEHRDDGVWIKWYPESEEQKNKIHRSVVNHEFDVNFEKK